MSMMVLASLCVSIGSCWY